MALPIEDYALITDCSTAALVGRDGSIDWLCLPRYDSMSVFGALLGEPEHGRWLVAPVDAAATSTRGYENDDFILVTRWTAPEGEVEVIDFMPIDGRPDVLRRIRGVRGRVRMREEVRLRFGYADAMPWIVQDRTLDPPALVATAGPDSVVRFGPPIHATDRRHEREFEVAEGETVDLAIVWFASYAERPPQPRADPLLERTRAWWDDFAQREKRDHGAYNAIVRRSLLTLRALTHARTGGIVAAATTSLPEEFGGVRNWDYRYVWLRDASMTISVLIRHGFADLVDHWRLWLLRAIAGDPSDVQIMYGLGGERRLAEWEVPSLPGYRGSAPVRVGNAAYEQYQADVIGEVMIALEEARAAGIHDTQVSWSLQRSLLAFVEQNIGREDQGLWETRGPARFYTESRVMVWAAFDCGVRAVRLHGLDGPAEHWEALRDQMRDEIEERGFDLAANSYVQSYGSTEVDAALLLLPQVGYCEPDSPRMLGTVAAIERDLLRDGLPLRYRTESGADGLPPGENPFLACAFWLVEQYAHSGRLDDARALMDRLAGFANDVGLLSEEYDVAGDRQAGNTPQALSHLALIRAADAIADVEEGRAGREGTAGEDAAPRLADAGGPALENADASFGDVGD